MIPGSISTTIRYLSGQGVNRSWRARVAFFATHTGLFLVGVLLLYRIFPQFLVQNHDGQNLYFMADKLWAWRDSWLDSLTFTPLEGTGTTIWPLNPLFVPFLWPFRFIRDPTLRIYLLSVIASLTAFIAALTFYAAVRVRAGVAVAAAWVTFAAFMLQTVDFMTGTDPLIAIAFTYLCLAAFMETGRGPLWVSSLCSATFIVSYTLLALAHPGWHLIGIPFLAFAVLLLTVTAETRREAVLKATTVGMTVAPHLVLGTYQSLLLMVDDTARVMLANRFVPYAHSPYLAGHLFRSSPTEILWGGLMIVGLVAGRLADCVDHARIGRVITLLTAMLYGGAVLGALWFLYSGLPWPLPKPSYVMLFAYPLSALFSVLGLLSLLEPGRLAKLGAWKYLCLGLLLVMFFAWHWHNVSHHGSEWFVALLAMLACWGVAGRWPRVAMMLAIPLLLVAFQRNIAALLGGGPDPRFDGIQRMGLVATPVVRFLADRVGLHPGDEFRGYADDAYTRRPGNRDLNDELVSIWAQNWAHYGSGQKIFSWAVFDIPILTQYSPYIKPLYFAIFASLLNEPEDRHVVNYLTITHPDGRILQMLGLRYLVTDGNQSPVTGAREAFSWDRFKIFELPRPNLGDYSPVSVRLESSAGGTLRALRDPQFDPQRTAIIHEPLPLGVLSHATNVRLTFERGGYSIRAKSQGESLLALPVQFSHCFRAAVIGGDPTARLFRINLVQTGLLFHNTVEIKVRFRHWPRATPQCQRLDRDDAYVLDVRAISEAGVK